MGCKHLKADYAGSDIITKEIEITPDTSAYADGDCIGGIQTLTDVFSDGESVHLLGGTLWEKKGSGSLITANIEVYFLNKIITLADNAAFTINGASLSPFDVATITQYTAGSYLTLETNFAINQEMQRRSFSMDTLDFTKIPITKKSTEESNSLWLILTNNNGGNITYTSGAKLYLQLHFQRN